MPVILDEADWSVDKRVGNVKNKRPQLAMPILEGEIVP
jgi:hypothetical protein